MARASSWNVDLEYKVHEVIAKEMRANKTNYAATPCINLLRHPSWGRAQETYGEDPWLLGEFGLAAVKAIEKHNVMACPKHFALNSIENSRWKIDVSVDILLIFCLNVLSIDHGYLCILEDSCLNSIPGSPKQILSKYFFK